MNPLPHDHFAVLIHERPQLTRAPLRQFLQGLVHTAQLGGREGVLDVRSLPEGMPSLALKSDAHVRGDGLMDALEVLHNFDAAIPFVQELADPPHLLDCDALLLARELLELNDDPVLVLDPVHPEPDEVDPGLHFFLESFIPPLLPLLHGSLGGVIGKAVPLLVLEVVVARYRTHGVAQDDHRPADVVDGLVNFLGSLGVDGGVVRLDAHDLPLSDQTVVIVVVPRHYPRHTPQ
mmetsp:Transcript_29323/g.59956  ORF Transcript_29323/g.59956 Transcript_29323/m.59956 type:complete len:234 (+) Transcript_29323:545-1246(+)